MERTTEKYKIVGQNIDTLIINYKVSIQPIIKKMLSSKAKIELGDYQFKITTPKGTRSHKYTLKNNLMRISINPEPHVSYSIKVKFNSYYLWSRGVKKAREKLLNILKQIGDLDIESEKISRADLAIDISGIDGVLNDKNLRDYIVTKANSRCAYQEGDENTGVTIGKGKLRANIYNKSKELETNLYDGKKELFKEIWGESTGDVWRIEYQIKREYLNKYGIDNFKDLESNIAGLWDYLTKEWLSIRHLDNNNTSRRTVMKFWRELVVDKGTNQLENMFKPKKELKKKITSKATKEHLISSIKGNITTLGAIEGLSYEEVIETLNTNLGSRFKEKYIKEKKIKKIKYQI